MSDSPAPIDVHPITRAETSTPVFIGSLPSGPSEPTRVSSRQEFRERFPAADASASFLPDVVESFFANGGTDCYILNIPQTADVHPVAAYLGSAEDRGGLAALESIDRTSILVVPDLWTDPDVGYALFRVVAGHCAQMGNRMALLHTPDGLTPEEAQKFPEYLGLDDETAAFTAVYYPWIGVQGPDGEARFVPPSGAVAGAWGRVDRERGVHKEPANVGLRGALSIPSLLTEDEHRELNEKGVNCLRGFPNTGLLVWGARTLSTQRDWKYINVRRFITFLGDSIRQSTNWAVFEPNDDLLRSSIRNSVTSFLADQWRNGALLGSTPEEAFYVTCDESNNDEDTIAQGIVNIDFGVSPMRPAEFITFRVSVPAGQRPTTRDTPGPAPTQESEVTPDDVAALTLEYRNGLPVLVTSGGTYIPAHIEVVDGEGSPAAAYTAGTTTPTTTRLYHAVDGFYLQQHEE